MGAALAGGLRQCGIDVTTSSEVDMLGATDRDQLEHATIDGRIFVTRDDDVLRLHALGVPHAGIIFWSSKRSSLGELIRNLELLFQTTSADELHGVVIYL